MAHWLTRDKKKEIATLIQENRQKYYDEHVDEARRVRDVAAAAWVEARNLDPKHPDYIAAKEARRIAWDVWDEWCQENDPSCIASEHKARRKKMLGNKKKNLAAQKRRMEVIDSDGLEAARQAVRRKPGLDFGDWIYAGALVTTKAGDLGLITELPEKHPEYVRIMINSAVVWERKAALRPVDEDDE